MEHWLHIWEMGESFWAVMIMVWGAFQQNRKGHAVSGALAWRPFIRQLQSGVMGYWANGCWEPGSRERGDPKNPSSSRRLSSLPLCRTNAIPKHAPSLQDRFHIRYPSRLCAKSFGGYIVKKGGNWE